MVFILKITHAIITDMQESEVFMKKNPGWIKFTVILIVINLFMVRQVLSQNNFNERGYDIPVLMYHSITEDDKKMFRVTKDSFYEQMKYLKDSGFSVLSMDEVYDHLKNNKPFKDKSIAITFDDGYKDNYHNAYPILKEFAMNATIFVVTDYLGGSAYLSVDEIKEMQLNNIDIESHTTNHAKLDKLTEIDRINTLKDSKDYIDEVLNKEVKYIAYPFGRCNKDVIADARLQGYKMAFTTKSGHATGRDDLNQLKRVLVSGYMNIDHFIKVVNK